MSDKSYDGLLAFLDWTAEKGLMAKNTVNGRKAAVSGVLGILDPEEKGDVTSVDLDNAMTRFINLQGKKYNPSSLTVYKSRTNAALNDFRKWLSDPLAFKPQSGKPDKPNGKTPKKRVLQTETAGDAQPSSPSPSPAATANVFPIQIRENLVVRIHGLPFDLTKPEAERIANVVKAMALE